MGAKATQPRKQAGLTTLLDDDSNAMLPAHAYLCNQDGEVEVIITMTSGQNVAVIGYDDTDTNPAAGGDIRGIYESGSYGGATFRKCFNFLMAKGRYFEITVVSATVTIRWVPHRTLIACTDYN